MAIGQKARPFPSVRPRLEDAGAMEYTTIVASGLDPATLRPSHGFRHRPALMY